MDQSLQILNKKCIGIARCKFKCIKILLDLLSLIQILSTDDIRYGYNAAKDRYEDLMAAGILDPSKVSQKIMS